VSLSFRLSFVSTKEFIDACQTLLERLEAIPDERSREIVKNGLTWALENPQELQYNTKSKRESYWITPNYLVLSIPLAWEGNRYCNV